MSDLDTRVINLIRLLPPHKVYSFLSSNLDPKLFVTRKREFKFLRAYAAKHGQMPTRLLFKRKFPECPTFRVKDPLSELSEELKIRYQNNQVSEFVDSIDPDTMREDLPEIMGKITALGLTLAQAETQASDHEYSSDFAQRYQTYKDRQVNIEHSTFTCGVPQMDEFLGGGITTPQLVVLAGDPKMGKTWFTVKLLAENYNKNKVVLYVSPEMSHVEIEFRTDALRFGLNYEALRMGKLSAKQVARWKSRAAQDMTPLYIVDTTQDYEFTPLKIAAKIELYKPDMVIIDSAYYLRADGVPNNKEESYLDRQRLVQQLKGLCKDKNLPIVCVVQMKSETEKNKLQNETALRGVYGGDHWAQGCDVLLRLTGNRSDTYRKLVLLANREGETFKEVLVKYQFDPHPHLEGVDSIPLSEDQTDDMETIEV